METPETDEDKVAHLLHSLTSCIDRLDSIDNTKQPHIPLPKLVTTGTRPPHTSSTRPLPQTNPQTPPKQRYPPAAPTPPPLPFHTNQPPSSARRRLRERALCGKKPTGKTSQVHRRGVIEDARTARIASLYSNDLFLGVKVEELGGLVRRARRRRKRKGNQEEDCQGVEGGDEGDGATNEGLDVDLSRIPWEVNDLGEINWQRLTSAQMLQPVRVVTSPAPSRRSKEFHLKSFDVGFDEESGGIPDEKWIEDNTVWMERSHRKEGRTPGFVFQSGLGWRKCEVLRYDERSREYLIVMCDDETRHRVHRVIVRFQYEDVLHFFTRMIRAVKCREIAIDLWRLEQYYAHSSKPVYRQDLVNHNCQSLARILLLVSACGPKRLRGGSSSTPNPFDLVQTEDTANGSCSNQSHSSNPVKSLMDELGKILEVGSASRPDSKVLVDTIFTNMLSDNVQSLSSTHISKDELVQLTLKQIYPHASSEALAEQTSVSTLGRLISELVSLQQRVFHEAFCAYSVRLFTSNQPIVARAKRLEKLDERVDKWARPHLRKDHEPPDPGWRLERAARSLCTLEKNRENRLLARHEDTLICRSLRSDLNNSHLFHAPAVIGCLARIHFLGTGLSHILRTVSTDSSIDQSLLFPLPSGVNALTKQVLFKGSQLHDNALRMGLGVEWIELTALKITRTFGDPRAELLMGIDLRMEAHLLAFSEKSILAWLQSFRKRQWLLIVDVVERDGLRQRCTEQVVEVADHLLSSMFKKLQYAQSLKCVSSIVAGISSTTVSGSTRTLLPASLGLDCIRPPVFTLDSDYDPPPKEANDTHIKTSVWQAIGEVYGILQADARELLPSLHTVFRHAENAEALLQESFDEGLVTMSFDDIIPEDHNILYDKANLSDGFSEYYQVMEEFVQLRVDHLNALSTLCDEIMSQSEQIKAGVFLVSLTQLRTRLLEACERAKLSTVDSLMTFLQNILTLVKTGLSDFMGQLSLTPSSTEEMHSFQCLLRSFEDKMSRSNFVRHYNCAKKVLNELEQKWIRLTPEVNMLVFDCRRQWLALAPLKEQGRTRLNEALKEMHKANRTEYLQLVKEADTLEQQVVDFSLECNTARVALQLEASQRLHASVTVVLEALSNLHFKEQLCAKCAIGTPFPGIDETTNLVKRLQKSIGFLMDVWSCLEDVRSTRERLFHSPFKSLNQPLLEDKLRGKGLAEERLTQLLKKLFDGLNQIDIPQESCVDELLDAAIQEVAKMERIWPLISLLHSVAPTLATWEDLAQSMETDDAERFLSSLQKVDTISVELLVDIGIMKYEDGLRSKCKNILLQREVNTALGQLARDMNKWHVCTVPTPLDAHDSACDLLRTTDSSVPNAPQQQNQAQLIDCFEQQLTSLLDALRQDASVIPDTSRVDKHAVALATFRRRLKLIESARTLLFEAESRDLCESSDSAVLAARKILERCCKSINNAGLTFLELVETLGEQSLGSSRDVFVFVPGFPLLEHLIETLTDLAYT